VSTSSVPQDGGKVARNTDADWLVPPSRRSERRVPTAPSWTRRASRPESVQGASRNSKGCCRSWLP